MTDRGPPEHEIEVLRARIAALSAASLRISASLDLETVLNEVVESARALTGARYGAVATIDKAGAPEDFVTSGLTEEENRRLVEWPEGPRLFAYFRDLSGPLRLSDMPDYVRSLGFSFDRLPSRSFQGMPMRHRGAHVGNVYLVEKEGGAEFTDEDAEILVPFASQAAIAIANARSYRDEQRARADLEALVETSPVGRRGVRCRDRQAGLAQPRGDAHRGKPVHARPVAGAADSSDHLPARRRARDRAPPVTARSGVGQRRGGARRGNPALGP